ncbi:MAG: hypothetical protein QW733_01760 [Desulfurococcaceae archaeon]
MALSSVDICTLNEGKKKETGEPPSPVNSPPGCRFHPSCSYAMEICSKQEPPTIEIGNNHVVCCWLYTKRGS